jgi:adenylate kinase family enzyme
MSKKKATSISLPMSRTMKIMTSAVGVESVTQDAVAIATKATEIFLTDFARRAYMMSDSNVIDYDDITNLVHSDPRYDFIVDTTPKRIKFSEALKLIEEAKKREKAEEELEPEQDAATTDETKEQDQNGRRHGSPDSSSRPDSVESPPPDDQ